jgi:hypothetical protein
VKCVDGCNVGSLLGRCVAKRIVGHAMDSTDVTRKQVCLVCRRKEVNDATYCLEVFVQLI